MNRISIHGMLSALLMVFTISLFSCTLTRYASRGDVAGIEGLLAKGENINAYDRYGWTPLFWAVYYSQYEAVKYMLSRGANVNAQARSDYGSLLKGATPLMISAYYGNAEIARLLISAGADKNTRDRKGGSAASFAAEFKFHDVEEALGSAAALKEGPERGKKEREKVEKEAPARFEAAEPVQVLHLNDGRTITGKVLSHDRNSITVKTGNATMTVDKDSILETAIKE